MSDTPDNDQAPVNADDRSNRSATAAAAFDASGPFAAIAAPALLLGAEGVIRTNRAGADLAKDGAARDLLLDAARTVIRFASADQITLPATLADGRRLIDCTLTPWGGHALALCRDVTIERGVRQALELSRERYRGLLGLAADCIWETSPDGRIELLAPNDLFGAEAARLIGRSLKHLIVASAGNFYETGLEGQWTSAALVGGGGALVLGAAVMEPIQDPETGEISGYRGCFRQTKPLAGHASEAEAVSSPGG